MFKIFFRRNLNDLFEVVQLDFDTSSESSSDNDDDVDFVIMEMLYSPKKKLGKRLHLDDVCEEECEAIFR